ncbi:FMN-binding protein [Candidatus Contubernalis alkaliaceticus]|uniref:FMN-binding protein n=1 Tax=Candidatus Contubernalis alkaliaceticus TaxID=338645 RepID=UPI001F4BECFF|nr:RnfABCDGE type electron transport complex subunit G [Candidatus Contubernalis alkalaceticus]UNC90903.1 RnfABCDGE type electron transport complex subunit G [Candidatus Contubernalis alkalaceticus]
MGDIIKLSVVLALICVVAAGSLAFIEGITTPVILQREADVLAESLGQYVPDADSFEPVEVEGKTFYKALSGGQEIAYIMPDSRGAGYGGDVRVNVATDADGNVIAVDVVGHTETPGLGDKIEAESWLAQFVGKGISDAVAVGTDIDGIAGATVSARAAANAVRNALDEIGAAFLGVAMAEFDLASVEDGTYSGVGTGFGGDISIEVTVSGGKITSIEILDHSETAGLSDPAFAATPQDIIDAQDYEVDAVSGATMTSKGIMDAVFNALAN